MNQLIGRINRGNSEITCIELTDPIQKMDLKDRVQAYESKGLYRIQVYESKGLYQKLVEVDWDTTMVFAEARNKHDKAMLRVFANQNNLKFRYCKYSKFPDLKMFQCQGCKKTITSDDHHVWRTDYYVTMPGIYGGYYKCPNCGTGVSSNEDPPGNEFSDDFKVWTAANCVVLGKELGKWDRKPVERFQRKAKLDRTWSQKMLEKELNNNTGRIICQSIE